MEAISLTIIVPAYNAQRHIGACLAAICGQMRSHHELIVVNVASSDGTLDLVRRQQRQFHNINFTVCGQDRPDVAGARHRGACLARGDYLAFVGGDELLPPGALEAIDRLIARRAPELAHCVRLGHDGGHHLAAPPVQAPAQFPMAQLFARERRADPRPVHQSD
ncbi:glycosyltransferase family A protein [Rugamonas sp.]|uniref:glycosyltransferase family 2 protein n=1 Tax=Rugamonas sp. TaxID=1926287 RepID=UPI0025DB11CC|nr:glycosyltransferase family A protein [Rugamonas sp.]